MSKALGLQGYIKVIQERIKGQRVLDVGCCATYLKNNLKRHKEYAKSAGEIIGVDIQTEFLLQGQTDNPDLDLYRVDFTSVFEVGSFIPRVEQFDHIIATDILEHIDDARHFLKNLHTAGTPQAKYYFTVPNVKSPWWWEAFYKQKGEKVLNDDHVCWYDIDHLRRILGRQGFKIDEAFYCTHEQDKKAAKRLNVEWKDWMGRRLFVICSKKGVKDGD